MKNKIYWVHSKINRCIEETTEEELYGASICYGHGQTVLFFANGDTAFKSECVELSLENLKRRLILLVLSTKEKVFKV